MLKKYWQKMRGQTISPPGVGWQEIFWSWLGSFLGIGAVAGGHYAFFEGTDMVLIIGSFGASAMLIYGAPRSPFAQPRNLLGGHLISAVLGVTMVQCCGPWPWLAAALAVSLSVAAMHATRTLHPPRRRHRPDRRGGRPQDPAVGLSLRSAARSLRRPDPAAHCPPD